MKKTVPFILGFLFLFASASTIAFNFSSSDFGMDDDTYSESWGSDGPWKLSSGNWNTGPFGGGPFNMDSREWGAAPWNWGGRRSPWGYRNNPWGSRGGPWGNTPWNWNSRNWGGNRGPWNRSYRGYGNPYQRSPYRGWYGNPYHTGTAYETPVLPQAPSATNVDVE